MITCIDLLARKRSTQKRRLAVAAAAAACLMLAAGCVSVLCGPDYVLITGAQVRSVEQRRHTPGTPASHVYLLKTHKSASTTLQRIIIMYGIKHNLSFALPANGGHQFWPNPFSLDSAKRTAAFPHFDIMAVHARHSLAALSLMRSDTVFLSIVRDPAEHLQSVYEYYQIASCQSKATFEEFARALERNREGVVASAPRCPLDVFGNMQMYDFGFEPATVRSATDAWRSIDLLDRTFHLVLIAEMFDESLVLMGDLLNWSDADLVYVKANARPSPAPIADDVRQMIHKWNWADKMLYDHFRSKLERDLAHRREYVRRRVGELASLRTRWHSLCVKGVAASRASGEPGAYASVMRADVTVYELSDEGRRNDACALLTMPELGIIERLNWLWPEAASASAPAVRRPGAANAG